MPLLVGTWCGLFTTSIARIERIRVIRSFRRVSFHRGATQFGHPFPPLLMSSLSLHAFLPALVERTINAAHRNFPLKNKRRAAPHSVTAMDRLPADVQIESMLASLPYVYAVRDQWVVATCNFWSSRCAVDAAVPATALAREPVVPLSPMAARVGVHTSHASHAHGEGTEPCGFPCIPWLLSLLLHSRAHLSPSVVRPHAVFPS